MKGVAAFFVLLAGALVAGVIHLAFYFPKTVKIWEEEGQALSSIQILLIQTSSFCVANAVAVIAVAAILFLASAIWLIRA